MECLAPFENISPQLTCNGDSLFIEPLRNSDEKEVVIIATGPLTTLADILKTHSELSSKIRALYWRVVLSTFQGTLPMPLFNEFYT